jgi:hypothetical protein
MHSTLFSATPFMTIEPYTIPEVEAEWGIPAGAGRWQDSTQVATVVPTRAPMAYQAPAAPARRSEGPTNRYAGKCRHCGIWVEAEAGTRANVAGRWLVAHLAGQCPEPADEAEPAAPVAIPEPAALGYYLHAGQVVRVVKAKTSDRRYAKRISYGADGERATWDYVPGLVSQVTEAERLTVEQAAAYGHQHGNCMICGLALTVKKSVERGIGPVCYSKL